MTRILNHLSVSISTRGAMVKGKYEKTTKGTPQGGNLSPLLSNIMLNELDKELEARGLHFVRYADDCVITVKSSAAANRVMHTITSWIERKLGLKVNMTKTKVTTPKKLKYLGFGFWKRKEEWKARPHQESVQKFKRELKRLTRRSWSIGMTERIKRLNWVIRGWINYFRMGNMKDAMSKIDEWLRTRIRIIIWKQWKTREKRLWGLMNTRSRVKLGICGEHGGDPASIEFCHRVGLNYVSCSPFRVPIARLAAAQAAIKNKQ